MPRARKPEERFLTHEQVVTLADAAGEQLLVILVLAHCGLLWGQVAAVRVGRLDLTRRRIDSAESVTEIRGTLMWGSRRATNSVRRPSPASWLTPWPSRLPGEVPTTSSSPPRGRSPADLNFRRHVLAAGHASAAMTLEVHSGLFDDDLDAVADRMDAAARVPRACPEGVVTALGERSATS